jgi:hypothetical protein
MKIDWLIDSTFFILMMLPMSQNHQAGTGTLAAYWYCNGPLCCTVSRLLGTRVFGRPKTSLPQSSVRWSHRAVAPSQTLGVTLTTRHWVIIKYGGIWSSKGRLFLHGGWSSHAGRGQDHRMDELYLILEILSGCPRESHIEHARLSNGRMKEGNKWIRWIINFPPTVPSIIPALYLLACCHPFSFFPLFQFVRLRLGWEATNTMTDEIATTSSGQIITHFQY